MRPWPAYIAALAVIVIDRATKLIAVSELRTDISASAIPGFIYLTLVYNKGAAFGLFQGSVIALEVVSLVAIVCILLLLFRAKVRNMLIIAALGLVLGGAFGNLYDRIKLGYVIDFIDLKFWPVFNIADSAIFVGCSLVVFDILFCRK